MSERYREAERRLGLPPIEARGRQNMNPEGMSLLQLLREDLRTHGGNVLEQGFWALAVHRFGNWRMGLRWKICRVPMTVIYRVLEKMVEWTCGISLSYVVKVGRRVRIWHHSGIMIGARSVGDDVHLRQNTTIGVAQTGRTELPIIEDGVDIGAGACIGGAVVIGRNAKIGANAVVLTDVPEGATMMGVPAKMFRPQLYKKEQES